MQEKFILLRKLLAFPSYIAYKRTKALTKEDILYPYRLMAPGPVPLSPSSREILGQQMLHHRTPLFSKILNETWKLLKDLFQTKQEVLLLSSTGSGALEASICNLFSKEESILCIESGKFGERWTHIAKAYGLQPQVFHVEWGKDIDLAQLEKWMQKNSLATALCMQACETSTGQQHPVKEIATLCQKYKKLLLVDGITAVGAFDLAMDELGIDVLIAGGQKAMATPTGISYLALSDKAWQKSQTSHLPKFYFDLKKELNNNQKKGQTHFSSSVAHIRVLHNELKQCFATGLAPHLQQVAKRAEATRKGITSYGLELFPASPANSLSAVKVPENIDGVKLRQHIEDKYNMIFMGGQEQLKGKILRIGHMGYITDEDILASIELLGHALQDFEQSVDINSALKNVQKVLNS